MKATCAGVLLKYSMMARLIYSVWKSSKSFLNPWPIWTDSNLFFCINPSTQVLSTSTDTILSVTSSHLNIFLTEKTSTSHNLLQFKQLHCTHHHHGHGYVMRLNQVAWLEASIWGSTASLKNHHSKNKSLSTDNTSHASLSIFSLLFSRKKAMILSLQKKTTQIRIELQYISQIKLHLWLITRILPCLFLNWLKYSGRMYWSKPWSNSGSALHGTKTHAVICSLTYHSTIFDQRNASHTYLYQNSVTPLSSDVTCFFFAETFRSLFAETSCSLKHFGHLSHSCSETHRSSVH